MLSKRIVFCGVYAGLCLLGMLLGCGLSREGKDATALTTVTIGLPAVSQKIAPMIYGEMLEDCSDSIIYGGVVNADGSSRPRVSNLVRALEIPVVRWPGGTYSLEYHWERAIGPLDRRPVTEDFAWKGIDNNRFGTDEFLAWCRDVGTEAYINLNMGNQPPYAGTLEEALHWIEYVNGPAGSPFGRKRAANGHPEPYQVRYWGIGNENYGPWGRHDAEPDTEYAAKLRTWATAIRRAYPGLQLLGVGHTYRWDSTVLATAGSLINLLTQHYYVTSRVRDGQIEMPERTLFAPAKMEAHLEMLKPLVEAANRGRDSAAGSLKLSVDEWDNRHHVYDSGKYVFSRQDPRCQFDVAVVAGMLNVFIRQSAVVGMANYIFPVNGHGLIRSVGDTGAYRTAIYYVFTQYRKWMAGSRLDATVAGPGVNASTLRLYMDGEDPAEAHMDSARLNDIDASAVLGTDSAITVALVNRDAAASRRAALRAPEGYVATAVWKLESPDLNDHNTETDRARIHPVLQAVSAYRGDYSLAVSPAGLCLVRFEKRK